MELACGFELEKLRSITNLITQDLFMGLSPEIKLRFCVLVASPLFPPIVLLESTMPMFHA
jgi:hypothetical protein